MHHAIYRASERVTPLNVLQGLVLLGLLIDQVLGQLASQQQGHSSLLHDHHPDLPIQFMVQLLVRGQFDRIGSFLFGLVFYRCWQHAGLDGPGRTDARLDADRMVRRLLIGLLGIGINLSLLLGSVDLLVQYSMLGFTLLYFRKQSVSILLTWIVGLAGLAILMPTLLGLLHSTGLTQQSQNVSLCLSYELMMCFGLLVGKLGLSRRDSRLRVRLSLLQLVVMPTAILVKGTWVALTLGLVTLPQYVVDFQSMLLALGSFLGPLLLSLVYVLDVVLNARLTPTGWGSWIGRLSQLSLTNYALQSLLCPLLVYGYGLVVESPLSFLIRAGIVVVIYSFEIGFSYLWVKRYRQGPLEWVCRGWAEGKWRRSNAVPASKF